MKRFISLLFLIVTLTGCGADVVGTAATEAELSAQEAKQAQQLKDQVRSQIDAAMRTEQERLRQAEIESE